MFLKQFSLDNTHWQNNYQLIKIIPMGLYQGCYTKEYNILGLYIQPTNTWMIRDLSLQAVPYYFLQWKKSRHEEYRQNMCWKGCVDVFLLVVKSGWVKTLLSINSCFGKLGQRLSNTCCIFFAKLYAWTRTQVGQRCIKTLLISNKDLTLCSMLTRGELIKFAKKVLYCFFFLKIICINRSMSWTMVHQYHF